MYTSKIYRMYFVIPFMILDINVFHLCSGKNSLLIILISIVFIFNNMEYFSYIPSLFVVLSELPIYTFKSLLYLLKSSLL